MKNRELLNKICTYDLLCRINDGVPLRTYCVLNLLEKKDFNRMRCGEYATCEGCVADWLNEETKLKINERRQK